MLVTPSILKPIMFLIIVAFHAYGGSTYVPVFSILVNCTPNNKEYQSLLCRLSGRLYRGDVSLDLLLLLWGLVPPTAPLSALSIHLAPFEVSSSDLPGVLVTPAALLDPLPNIRIVAWNDLQSELWNLTQVTTLSFDRVLSSITTVNDGWSLIQWMPVNKGDVVVPLLLPVKNSTASADLTCRNKLARALGYVLHTDGNGQSIQQLSSLMSLV